jgi:uncharacterized membrane protein YgdD (TMEM256/DUF423 family)
VALGAFGAHGLPEYLQRQGIAAEDAEHGKRLANFDTAARYQLVNALAIVLVGLLARVAP